MYSLIIRRIQMD